MRNSEQILKVVEEFFQFGHASDLVEINNDLLQSYLEIALSPNKAHTPRYIREVVYVSHLQTKLIVALQECLKNDSVTSLKVAQ